jgi:hypothetical protein
MLHQQVDHRTGLDVVLGRKAELGKHTVLANQVSNRVLQDGDERLQLLSRGFGFQILNGLELDTELFGNRHSIGGAVSAGVVEDNDVSHGLNLPARWNFDGRLLRIVDSCIDERGRR